MRIVIEKIVNGFLVNWTLENSRTQTTFFKEYKEVAEFIETIIE